MFQRQHNAQAEKKDGHVLIFETKKKRFTAIQVRKPRIFFSLVLYDMFVYAHHRTTLLHHAQFVGVTNGRKIKHHFIECVFVKCMWHGHHRIYRYTYCVCKQPQPIPFFAFYFPIRMMYIKCVDDKNIYQLHIVIHLQQSHTECHLYALSEHNISTVSHI